MTSKQIIGKALRFELAPIDWATSFGELSSAERQQLSRTLDSMAQQAVRMSEYLSAVEQSSGPISAETHAAAVKAQNRKLTKVRKAMGYSIPKYDLSFGIGRVS